MRKFIEISREKVNILLPFGGNYYILLMLKGTGKKNI